MKNPQHIVILGGGPAGLAAAFYAFKNNQSFILIEKNSTLGGNAQTFSKSNFLYDSGAHRWHNVYPEVTQDILDLLPTSLKKISAPSSIAYKNKKIQFPLSPLNLLRELSLREILAMGLSYINRHSNEFEKDTFANHIQSKYGKKVSEAFLWHYSEKLWGESPAILSNEISGKRLKGLNLKAFFKKEQEHLDGSFYYPKLGIGEISHQIEKTLPKDNLRTNSTIRKIEALNNKLVSIDVDGNLIDCSESLVINTLSPKVFRHLCRSELIESIDQLNFRSLVLIFLEIDKTSISSFASIYFPDKNSPITRVVEPRNRSVSMSPEGKTSLVLEWPCKTEDRIWLQTEDEILAQARLWVNKYLSIKEESILGGEVKKMPLAYPILKKESIAQRKSYLENTANFVNLKHLGRNATFSYLHLHDIFYEAKRIIKTE